MRSGKSILRLRNLAEPEDVERALDGRVPAPRERVDAVDDETVLTALQHSRVFWRGWRSDEPLPPSAVVTDGALVSKLDCVGDPLADSDENRSRRSSPGADRPNTLDGLERDGNGGNAEDFTGGTLGSTAGYPTDE